MSSADLHNPSAGDKPENPPKFHIISMNFYSRLSQAPKCRFDRFEKVAKATTFQYQSQDVENIHGYDQFSSENVCEDTVTFHLGATILISLGILLMTISAMSSLMSVTNRDSVQPASSHSSKIRNPSLELSADNSLANDFEIYKAQQAMLLPPANSIVKMRSWGCRVYHWHPQCPSFDQGFKNGRTLFIIPLTRYTAEKQGCRACHFCCDLEVSLRNVAVRDH